VEVNVPVMATTPAAGIDMALATAICAVVAAAGAAVVVLLAALLQVES